MTPLADAVARVDAVAQACETAREAVHLYGADKDAHARDLRTLLAALPTPEDREAISAGADYLYGDQRERLIDYLNRTSTGGATEGFNG